LTLKPRRRIVAPVKKFLQSWLINTLAVLVAVYTVRGLTFLDSSYWTPFIVALVLGILNAFIRPILMLLTLPLVLVTLGFFRLVINAALLYFVGYVLHSHFHVDGFGAAFLGALVISIVSFILQVLTGGSNAKVRLGRRRPPPPDGGNGPVIDV
jgi:putative membrane protein